MQYASRGIRANRTSERPHHDDYFAEIIDRCCIHVFSRYTVTPEQTGQRCTYYAGIAMLATQKVSQINYTPVQKTRSISAYRSLPTAC